MPERQERHTHRLSIAAAIAMTALILVGAFVWFRPYLIEKRQSISEVPAPAALFAVGDFAVPAGEHVCMSAIGMNPNSRVAEFRLRPATPTSKGGPPIELNLSAPGYRAALRVRGGYLGGGVALPITPPKRSLIGTACFANLGRSTVLLEGTTEPRTISRSAVRIDGRLQTGDIFLAFSDNHPSSLLDSLDEVFGHSSNLTGRLVPVWLIWVVAMITLFGVPLATILAFYRSLRADERANWMRGT